MFRQLQVLNNHQRQLRQIPPRLPGGGANVPTEGGSAEQPLTPQDDNQGGGLPTIKNQENVPLDGGVANWKYVLG